MAWIGGTAGAAAAAGMHEDGGGKARCIYLVSLVVAVIAFVVVLSQI